MRAESLFFIFANNLNIYSLVYTFFFLCVNQDQQLRKSCFFRESEENSIFWLRQKDCYFIISVSLLAFYCGSYSIIILYFYFYIAVWREAQGKKNFLKVIFVFYYFIFFSSPLQKFQWPFFSELWNFFVCKLSDFLLLE